MLRRVRSQLMLFLSRSFLSDAQNGTLAQVALIEGGYESGLDEHPNDNVQMDAQYAASLMNGFMASSVE